MAKLRHANILSQIKSTVKDDVKFIQEIQNSNVLSKEVKELYSSLRQVKDRILKIMKVSLPLSMPSISTPAKLEILHYKEEVVLSKSEDIIMLKIMLEIENDQIRFIQQALKNKGLPDGIRSKLEEIYKLYLKVSCQLNQSRKKALLIPIAI